MPRIYKGQKWEVQYRRDVRSIRDGLTASKNGRGEIKATQLLLKNPDSDKRIAVCWAKNLPWTKRDRKRNLKIIHDAINRMDKSPDLNLKDAISLSANEYDLSVLNENQPKQEKKMPIITNDNHKGCSLEEFVDFNLDELYLLDDIINDLKNNRPPKIDSAVTETLNLIQAKVLIRTAQP